MQKKGNLFKSVISLLLAVSIVMTNFNFTLFAANLDNSQFVSVDGYEFEILRNTVNNVVLGYGEDDKNYIITLDRFESDIYIETTDSNIRNRSAIINTYSVNIDSFVNNEFNGLQLVDESSNKTYDIDALQNARFAFAIPIGIPLLAAAIQALLLTGSVIIVAGIAYTVAEEIVQELQRKNEFKFFHAKRENNKIYLGGGLTHAAAKAAVLAGDTYHGVFAIGANNAQSVCVGGYRGPEGESSSGYWKHYHPNAKPAVHVWFY